MERPGPEENPYCREVELRKQLLLLATLVVGVTYMAGINPPGRVSQVNRSGNNSRRYFVYHNSNPTVLAAAVVVIFLLLLGKPRPGPRLLLLRLVTWLVLIGLMTNQLAVTTLPGVPSYVYTVMLFSINFFYISLQVYQSLSNYYCCSSQSRREEEPRQGTEHEEELDDQAPLKPKEERKVLMLLASFMMVITYVAGLSSSGGYWGRIESSNQNGNDPLMGLKQEAKIRSKVFFYFNTATFVASQLALVLLLSKNMVPANMLPPPLSSLYRSLPSGIRPVALYGSIFVGLLGLLGAYAAVTYRNTDTHVYVLCLIAAFLIYISIVIVMISAAWWCRQSSSEHGASDGSDEQEEPVGNTIRWDKAWSKVKSLIVMLATLVAAITYQEGLHPPGGAWADDQDGHHAGDPIILSTHPWRYKVFLYCNSGAFVSSLAIILTLMVHKEKIHQMLLVSVILDIVALMVAYAAGSLRDARSSIYLVLMVVSIVVVIYVMIHLFCVTLRKKDMDYARLAKKRHTRLLLVTNLVATITYQAGLNPPGGFLHQEDDGHSASAKLVMDNYPRHFWAVFYCNTVSFTATMALILFFLLSPNQYQLGTRWYSFYTCIALALLGLMAAYAVGTVTPVRIYTFVLLALVVSVIALHTISSRSFMLKKEVEEEEEEEEDGSSAVAGPATIPRPRPRPRHVHRTRHQLRSAQEMKYRQVYTSHKRLMFIGIVAASATYQAGLNPPGGLWQDNGDHGGAGSPVMYDRYRQRYLTFFYANSTSFVASVFILALQLWQIIPMGHQPIHRKLVRATNIALGVILLCLMAAYTAGAARRWEEAISLFVLVLFCVAIHAGPSIQATIYSWMHHFKATERS